MTGKRIAGRHAWSLGWALWVTAGLVGGCLRPASDLGGARSDGGPSRQCTIADVVYAAGVQDPTNACQICQPLVDSSAWSPAEDATSCGDAGLFCVGGACAAPCLIGGAAVRLHQHNPAHLNQCCLPSVKTTAWSEWFQDAGQIDLGEQLTFPLVLADFNGDGTPDMALGKTITMGTDVGVAVLMGHGDGTFAEQFFRIALPAPIPNLPLLGIDLDGDGFEDLISGAPVASVFRNRGDGTFDSPSAISGCGFFDAAGDFDGDGLPDVVCYGPDPGAPSMLLARSLGDGGFADPITIYAGAATDGFPTLLPARLRGKGHPLDLVLSTQGMLSVLLGNGDGTFVQTSYGSAPGSIQVVDFNGDGRDDLISSPDNDPLLYIRLSGADGTLAPAILTALDFPRGVEQYVLAADFDGDHLVDLVGIASEPPGQTATNLLWRLPDGGLSAPIAIGSPGYLLDMPDLNQDGAPDLLTSPSASSGSVVQIYLNACGAP